MPPDEGMSAPVDAGVLEVSPELRSDGLRELGSDAVFTISSAKPGNGVEQLRDNNLETFWQSDGQAPHLVNIQFVRKTSVSKLCFFVDYGLDESYTAKKITVKTGLTQHDLVDVAAIELLEPSGWCHINIKDTENGDQPLRTHLIQMRIQSMHQNGRDTHIRQIKIFGPRRDEPAQAFKSVEMLQFAGIR